MFTSFGHFKLFKLFGITVYLDWLMWLVIGIGLYYWEFSGQKGADPVYTVAIYVCLFAIVLTHEFGHALACRSVGGKAERIVLTPLGGVAYVSPPPRPGAYLWSIAAGPLVNVVLVPVTILVYYLCRLYAGPGPTQFAFQICLINGLLLVFNMLPIYPLDGGQILQSLLWFVVGRAWSLLISGVIGLVGAAAMVLFAVVTKDWWYIFLVFYLGPKALQGFRLGQALHRLDTAPTHALPRCPACQKNPPAGAFWRCPCGTSFDTFASSGSCPHCGTAFPSTMCPRCYKNSPLPDWFAHLPSTPAPPPPSPPPPPPPPPPTIAIAPQTNPYPPWP